MNEKLRIILDTNTYEFIKQKYLPHVLHLLKSKKIVIYGCKTVREELRNIPKSDKIDGKSRRNILLSLYDELVKDHDYFVGKIVEILAEEYWKAYAGGIPKRKIFPDFLIVAVASMHNLDIVVSEDESSMKSNPALQAYRKVNERSKFRTPNFNTLDDLLSL